MKTLYLLFFGIVLGGAVEHYGQVVECCMQLVRPGRPYTTPSTPDQLPALVAANVNPNSTALLHAAELTEAGDTVSLNEQIYELGNQINASVINSLNLSPAAKAELDRQLAANYPEIGKGIRKSYLEQIKTLKAPAAQQLSSTVYKTKAEILSAAIYSNMCAFSNLILLPMRINIGIAGNIAAGYAFNDPCQYLLSGVTTKLGDAVYQTGIIKDLDVLQTRLTAEKRSAIAQLATSETQINVKASETINRSLGTLARWEAAGLTIQYAALVQYGYDLSEGFTISRDDRRRLISIELPPVKLLHINLDPVNTDAQDGGIVDLTNENFRAVYQRARKDAIALAEKQGAKGDAEQQIRSLLNCIYQPFTNNGKFAYQIRITNKNNLNTKLL